MQILEISKGLLTPAIAMIAIWIAWQQLQTNKHRFKLERYDRRLRVYEEVIKILSIISRDANVSPEDMLKFRKSVSEADFLFGPEIPAFIDEIYKRGLLLWQWNVQYKDDSQNRAEDYDHKKVVTEMHKQFRWLNDQFKPAKEKFTKYLDISN